MQQISDRVYQIPLGAVNSYLIEDNGLILVDTGYKNSTDKIFASIKKSGKNPSDIKKIILTHSHPDHAGSAYQLKTELNVPVYAHREDADLIRQGIAGRMPFVLSPGLPNLLIFNLFIKNGKNEVDAFEVDHTIEDNDVIPIAGGIQVVHTPGHSKGHVALLVKNEGVMICADICSNMVGLDLSTVYEDRALGIESIQKVAALDFDKALFGHGKPIIKGANKKLREKFGEK